jgi:hypothetical protein
MRRWIDLGFHQPLMKLCIFLGAFVASDACSPARSCQVNNQKCSPNASLSSGLVGNVPYLDHLLRTEDTRFHKSLQNRLLVAITLADLVCNYQIRLFPQCSTPKTFGEYERVYPPPRYLIGKKKIPKPVTGHPTLLNSIFLLTFG